MTIFAALLMSACGFGIFLVFVLLVHFQSDRGRKVCPHCLTTIPSNATRCPNCTSRLSLPPTTS